MGVTIFTGGSVLIAANTAASSLVTHALAVRDGVVVAHGDEALALAEESNSTAEIIDLQGGTLAPAPGDGHAHPMFGGLEALGPNIRAAEDLQGILDAVAEWKAANPDAKWIVGGSYDSTFTPRGEFDARWLDEVTGDTPTILRAWDYHTAWVNSAALKVGGITADTPDPELGRIVRREDGSPLGTLQESAANNFLANVVPSFTLEQRVGAIEAATQRYAAQGTTWVQDAWVEPGDLEVYFEAAKQNRLHARVNLAFRADPLTWRDQVTDFIAARNRVRETGAERLTGETVKFFLDGVVESHTAAMLEPYADRPDERGLPNWTPDELTEALKAFDAEGFQLHLHAIGDAANRYALDGLEAVRESNPKREHNHVIAHVAVLSPEDVERFAKLDVIANFEPYWAQCDAVMLELTTPHLGHEREHWQYLIGSVSGSGATVSFGSDWPVTTPDWRPALATAVTRHDPTDPEAESWIPEERVSAATAFAAYTTGIARQALAPNRGTLEVGKTADLVWLSANPLEITPTNIPSIEVRGTWLAGNATYRA
ncbi:amidohydrolase [Leucobacter denitrificans]|uniref:Amidohydrolase n=1 Tax=Leucobacter denitrificans TaxID=683042 RepID=A0A7G9S7F5_9MICO|nr:amidohydrolase [Leucobacter denitrificans]QNN63780.1 amidohydrolase [Leucobacter denitrificans]